MLTSYIQAIVVLFGAALVVIALSQRLKIPSVAGFLITGVLVGPGGFRLIRDITHVEVFAELGVVFLLFIIGLELSPKRLRHLGRFFLLGGLLQSLATIGLTTLISVLLGFSLRLSFLFGFILSLSSTAIVLKIYGDRKELNSPHGELSMGILLFQDFLIVPLLILVPFLAGRVDLSVTSVVLRFGGITLVIAAVFAVSRYLMPYFLQMVVQTRIRELFVIGALFVCLGAALITEHLGFSMALGAFLAGILISESDYYHEVIAETSPFRDVFNSIFFISVGMLIRFDFVASHFPAVLAAGLLILVIKTATGLFASSVLALPFRVGFMTAVGLSQIGEFSFVLIRAAHAVEMLDERLYQTAIAASIFTMILTPVLIHTTPLWIMGRKKQAPAAGGGKAAPANRVLVVGYGLAGRQLSGVLKAAMLPYTIVELNGRLVKEAKAKGEPVLYGDATRRAILEQADIATADIIVFVISDPVAVRRGVCLARQMNPTIHIIVRTREMAEIDDLRRCGANEVVSEEFETSIEIFTNVLTHLKVPGNIIRTQTNLLREDGYQMLRVPAPKSGIPERLVNALSMGTIDNYLVLEGHYAAGRSFRDLDLRKITGATVLAVVRDNKPITNPPADLVVSAGDILVLVGNHAQIDKAFVFLENGSQAGS